MQLSYQVFHARHQFFDWKLETRRGLPHPHQRHLRDAVNSLRGQI
jgi:hypothetical protein